ncbi:MAG: oxidoreductase [Frankiales bacterium]|nr:oxidoreductase [Frankiales bacterium]
MSGARGHVGIVGAGIAGLSLATFLARDGWRVTVLERSPDLGPVGAGFMLQHLGQQVAHRLGIGDELSARSSPVRRVDARTVRGTPVLRFAYDDGAPDALGWGVHRGALFGLLHEAALGAGAEVVPCFEAADVSRAGAGWTVIDPAGERRGPFDLLVGADGAASRIRPLAFATKFDRPYSWGALWSIVPDVHGLNGDTLIQVLRGTSLTLGLLPTGGDRTSIFWTVRARDADAAVAAGPQAFIDRVAPLAGSYAPLIEATADAGLLAAKYRDVVVRSVVGDRCVLVGDAAHAMSPQLGTGASMGLADAWTLAWALRTSDDLQDALAVYADQRRRHVAYYRFWSRTMTPIFQSGLRPIGPPRDAALRLACTSRFARAQMVGMFMGTRTSPWSSWSLPG